MGHEYMRTDAILMEILQERKTITGFLDAVFGFLKRNTDFYHIKKGNIERVGFPKGMREQILFGTMQRYDPECQLSNLAAEEDGNGRLNHAPPAVDEIEVETESEETNKIENVKVEVKKINTEPRFLPADHKNGAEFVNYCWSQTLKDVEIHIKLPPETQSAKQITIEIKADSIVVSSRSRPDVVVFGGKLSNRYKHNDAVWTIAERKLILNIDKAREIWWEKLLITERPIDLTKLDCERYIDELPEESQAAIQKLRLQQIDQDKDQLEISSEESETLEKLRTAWNAEGSPFRGQPFDPSMVKFS